MSEGPDSLPSLNSMDCWDYTVELECLDGIQDLRLAAELGQTLLERNKELEISLQQHQNLVEDQAQKIEYLTKQTAALREVNNSRLRIYEQLEVSIQELERANHRLVLENSAEKKRIKTSNATVESLETKCEDLQSTIDDLKLQLEALKRKSLHDSSDAESPTRTSVKTREAEEKRDDSRRTDTVDSAGQTETKSRCDTYPSPQPDVTTEQPKSVDSGYQNKEDCCENDGIVEQLLTELRKTRTQCTRDERRITELEEQLSTMVQQNQALENQVIELAHREEDLNVKSMHEELISLDEVRLGQTCSRCLRSIDYNSSSDVLDDDDVSIVEALPTLRSSFSMDVQDYPDDQSSPIKKQFENPYKDLVEKYESLVEGRKSIKPNHLQEEMQMSGDYKALSTDEESGHGDSLRTEKHHKTTRKTLSSPTEFSEAETNSSGFTDETSNKFTQTDGHFASLHCTIGDGDNYQFSIYDDATPIESRFHEMPEYRNVFKEVFHVLKDAAEKKQRGVDLPLLDEYTPAKVAPAAPSLDASMDFPDDDSQSVVSTMSELSISQNEPTTVVENVIQSQNQPMSETVPQATVQERVLRPLMRNNLEFVSVEVRKRSSSRRKNKYSDRSDSPVTHIIGSPKISYSSKPIGRNRREQSKNASPETDNTHSASPSFSALNSMLALTGNSLVFDPSNRVASPTPSQSSVNYEFKPSSASQDLNKLKRLDLSYAQVLSKADSTMIRLANSGKGNMMRSMDSATGSMLRGKHSVKGNGRNSSRPNPGGNSSRYSKKRPT